MPILHILKNMGLEIIEVEEDLPPEGNSSQSCCRSNSKKVLKKLGEKFKISAAVIQLGILGCDTTKWNDKIINKNPFFCPDKSMLKIWENTY